MRRKCFQLIRSFDISSELDTAYCVISDKTKALEGERLGSLLN